MNACGVYFVFLPLNYNRSLAVTEEMQAVHQLSVVDIDNQTISNATGEWVSVHISNSVCTDFAQNWVYHLAYLIQQVC